MTTMNAAALESSGVSWVRAHEALSRLAKARATADAEEGRWLLAAQRSAVHVHLGFGCFAEYVERLFGYGPRFIREKLRVAEALEELPALGRALEEGTLSWSAVRELTRVAVPETEAEWLKVAQGKTARQLEELVAGQRRGATPDAPPDISARRHVLRFEVEAETFAVFRQALAELRRRSGSSFDDDAVLMEMARQVLGGPTDEGRASYQIAVSVCAECGTGRQEAGSDAVAIGSNVLAMASCDAQHLGRVEVLGRYEALPANDAEPIQAGERVKRGVLATADTTHGGLRAKPDASPAVGTTHVGHRAKQDVPPSVRRAVLRRDEGRCRVPGCRNSRFLDLHHVALRSEGGSHRADNLLTVCGGHHRALHRGELSVECDAAGLRFQHADGSVYGGVANPKLLDTVSKVFSALRRMGFRESEVRRALDALREREALQNASIQEWLRGALQWLTPMRR
jgi:hypothetical protein